MGYSCKDAWQCGGSDESKEGRSPIWGFDLCGVAYLGLAFEYIMAEMFRFSKDGQ